MNAMLATLPRYILRRSIALALAIFIVKAFVGNMYKNTTAIGNMAESLACQHLIDRRFKIIVRNYRDRFCEIDIIASNKEYICFIEVKYRNTESFGGGLGAVGYHKQNQLKRSAEYWLSRNNQYSELQPRIDVIAIDSDKHIECIENAIN